MDIRAEEWEDLDPAAQLFAVAIPVVALALMAMFAVWVLVSPRASGAVKGCAGCGVGVVVIMGACAGVLFLLNI